MNTTHKWKKASDREGAYICQLCLICTCHDHGREKFDCEFKEQDA